MAGADRAAGFDQDAAQTAVLAANQGLYNGFLAAGLIWCVIRGNREFLRFFLLCVIAAGIYGALTASFTILYIQALLALALDLLRKREARIYS